MLGGNAPVFSKATHKRGCAWTMLCNPPLARGGYPQVRRRGRIASRKLAETCAALLIALFSGWALFSISFDSREEDETQIPSRRLAEQINDPLNSNNMSEESSEDVRQLQETTPAPTPMAPPCFICGEGNPVLNPDGGVDLGDGGEPISCNELDLGGQMGFIPEDLCGIIQGFAEEPCCTEQAATPTMAPTGAPIATEQTVAPTAAPTSAPVTAPAPGAPVPVPPTAAPVASPTATPVAISAPTTSPVVAPIQAPVEAPIPVPVAPTPEGFVPVFGEVRIELRSVAEEMPAEVVFAYEEMSLEFFNNDFADNDPPIVLTAGDLTSQELLDRRRFRNLQQGTDLFPLDTVLSFQGTSTRAMGPLNEMLAEAVNVNATGFLGMFKNSREFAVSFYFQPVKEVEASNPTEPDRQRPHPRPSKKLKKGGKGKGKGGTMRGKGKGRVKSIFQAKRVYGGGGHGQFKSIFHRGSRDDYRKRTDRWAHNAPEGIFGRL